MGSILGIHEFRGDMIPVMVMFDPDTMETDKAIFLSKNAGIFNLKYEFSIIPALSGYIHVQEMDDLELPGETVSIRLNRRLVLEPSVFSLSTTSAEGDNWWDTVVRGGGTGNLTGTGVKVGVLDTGIGFPPVGGGSVAYHADLDGKVVSHVNFATGTDDSDIFDRYGHGTHVAGIIAGSGVSSGGEFSGIAPGVSLYNIKVLNESGSGFEDDIIRGIEWAVDHDLDIINLSLGGGDPDPNTPESMAVNNATRQGLIVVVSAGNEGPRYMTGGSPGSATGAITVGASGRNGTIASFSSRGPTFSRNLDPDIVAPGEDIISVLGYDSFLERYATYYGIEVPGDGDPRNNYLALDGTSMAAPFVTGAIALLLESINASVPPSLVRELLRESAMDLGFDPATQGAGQLDISAFLSLSGNVSSMIDGSAKHGCIFPRVLPYAPFDVVGFPGRFQSFPLSLFHANLPNVSLQLDQTLLNANGILVSFPDVLVFNDSSTIGEDNVLVNITTLENATAGNHSAVLRLLDDDGELLDQLNLSFTLRYPVARVYLESFHSLLDTWSSSSRSSPVGIDYYFLAKMLEARNVELVTSMDYWQGGYNATTSTGFITTNLLNRFDAVILPPPVIGYFPSEVDALVNFHAAGGDVIVLGRRFQDFDVDSTNQLLSALRAPEALRSENLEMFIDNGWDYEFEDLSLTVNGSHQLVDGVVSLAWNRGCILESLANMTGVFITSSGRVLENLTAGERHVAAYLKGDGESGDLFVVGSDLLFELGGNMLDDAFMPVETVEGVEDNAVFIWNLMDEMLHPGEFRVLVDVDNTTFSSSDNVSVKFTVINTVNGSGVNVTSVSCEVFDENLTKIMDVELGNPVTGVYQNTSIGAAKFPTGESLLVVTVVKDSTTRRVNTTLFKWPALLPPTTAVSIQNVTTLYSGESIDVGFNTSVSGVDVLVSVNRGNPLSAMNASSFLLQGGNGSSISIPGSLVDGAGRYYFAFAGPSPLFATFNYEFQRVSTRVFTHEPVIDEDSSSVDGISLGSLDAGDGMVRLVPVFTNNPVSFSVVARDEETEARDLAAFLVFYPTYVIDENVGILPYGSRPFKTVLSYDDGSGTFSGAITIPDRITFSVRGETLVKSLATTDKYSGLILVVVRDADGALDVHAVLLNIYTLEMSTGWIWVVAIVAGVGLVFGLSIFFSREKRKRMKELETREPGARGIFSQDDVWMGDEGFKYCPYCGDFNRPRSRYCKSCGREINF